MVFYADDACSEKVVHIGGSVYQEEYTGAGGAFDDSTGMSRAYVNGPCFPHEAETLRIGYTWPEKTIVRCVGLTMFDTDFPEVFYFIFF